jgi:hypothetical protein
MQKKLSHRKREKDEILVALEQTGFKMLVRGHPQEEVL